MFEPEGLSFVKQAASISSSAEAIITKVTTTRITSETTLSTETMVRESNAVQALFQIVKMSQVQLKALVAFYQSKWSLVVLLLQPHTTAYVTHDPPLIMAVVGNIGFNYSLTWPALFEAIVDELAVFNIDVMSVLGLNCTFKRFDYIDTSELTPSHPLGVEPSHSVTGIFEFKLILFIANAIGQYGIWV